MKIEIDTANNDIVPGGLFKRRELEEESEKCLLCTTVVVVIFLGFFAPPDQKMYITYRTKTPKISCSKFPTPSKTNPPSNYLLQILFNTLAGFKISQTIQTRLFLVLSDLNYHIRFQQF